MCVRMCISAGMYMCDVTNTVNSVTGHCVYMQVVSLACRSQVIVFIDRTLLNLSATSRGFSPVILTLQHALKGQLLLQDVNV